MKDILILVGENPGLIFSYSGMFFMLCWLYLEKRAAHKLAIEERNQALVGEKDAILLLASNQAKSHEHLTSVKTVMEQMLRSQDAQIDLLRAVRDEQLLTRPNNVSEHYDSG